MRERKKLVFMIGTVIFAGALLSMVAIFISARTSWQNRYPVAAAGNPSFIQANN